MSEMITAEKLLDYLGKPVLDSETRDLLAELGLTSMSEIEDMGDFEATKHGVAVWFMTAQHLRSQPHMAEVPGTSLVVAQVMFSAGGLVSGGPGFAGALPYGLAFTQSRAAVRARLGEPGWTSPLDIPIDRWTFGERFLTLNFSEDETRIRSVACGLSWTL
jgi:hypothetical protein